MLFPCQLAAKSTVKPNQVRSKYNMIQLARIQSNVLFIWFTSRIVTRKKAGQKSWMQMKAASLADFARICVTYAWNAAVPSGPPKPSEASQNNKY